VQGMGPRRVDAVVQRYDTLWSARRADVDEIATLPGMNRSLAEKVRQAMG
jgi:excinuclease UvrABC nuclease subunit